MAEEIFDFGFTLVDEDELDTVQEIEQKVSETSSTVEATQEKLDKLFGAIQPLLNNLKANPEKELIDNCSHNYISIFTRSEWITILNSVNYSGFFSFTSF